LLVNHGKIRSTPPRRRSRMTDDLHARLTALVAAWVEWRLKAIENAVWGQALTRATAPEGEVTNQQKLFVLLAEIRQCINDDHLMAAQRKITAIEDLLPRWRSRGTGAAPS
jgi:hypothetical protein